MEPSKTTHPLDRELKFFAKNRAEWAKVHLGKFALVKEDKLHGVFDDPETALNEGVRLFGTEPFLIRQVTEKEEKLFIPALALGILHAHIA